MASMLSESPLVQDVCVASVTVGGVRTTEILGGIGEKTGGFSVGFDLHFSSFYLFLVES